MIDQSFLKNALLGENYFPCQSPNRTELPSSFTSKSFVNFSPQKVEQTNKRNYFDAMPIGLSRFDNTIRWASIPHPIAYYDLVEKLVTYWDDLQTLLFDRNSKIKPTQHSDGRLIIMKGYENSEEEDFHEPDSLLSPSKFGASHIVFADVKSFFPSIYTHALPWALVSQNTSKKNKEPIHWYNQIDRAFSNCKRGETHGVHVGPGTSNIAGEIILSRVDACLRNKGFINFERHIDDYKYFASSAEDATKFLDVLQTELYSFELHLNDKKTIISQSPLPDRDEWLLELSFRIPTDSTNLRQIQLFWQFAHFLANKGSAGSVYRYALSVITKSSVPPDVLQLLIPEILETAYLRPEVAAYLQTIFNLAWVSPVTYWQQLQKMLFRYIDTPNSDAVVWILDLLLVQNCEIPEETISKLFASRHSLAIALFFAKGAVKHTFESKWLQKISNWRDEGDIYLLDKNWLLEYQLNLRIENNSNPEFNELYSQNVRFIV